ncbi:MAG: non-canonical purine NTP pyrophosphatase [Acidimicrobiia bacterium]
MTTDRPGGTARRLVAATANPDKLAEIAALLTAAGYEVLPRPATVAEVEEDGDTLEANARLKAVAIVAAAGGLPAVADDTGLEVDALGGAPGIHAARYAGPEASYEANVDKLLAELDRVGAVTPEARRARFRTVALVRWPDGREVVCHGVIEGHITRARRGGGWGYDPVFEPAETGGLTFGELSAGGKDAISHRGRAFRALAEALASAG